MSEMPSCEAIINELRDEALKYPDTGWLSDLARRDLTWDGQNEIIIIGSWYGSVDVGHLAAIVESLIDKKTQDLTTRLEQAEEDRVKLRNRLDAMRRQRDGYRNQLRKTEPTKEKTMTSKTFKSDNELAKTISITRSQGRVLVEIEDPKHLIAINLSDNNAPALALAILEAAGHRPAAYDPERLSGDDLLAYIAHRLAVHVGDEAKRTAEAEAQEKLEAEALDLFNAGDMEGEFQSGPYDSFAQIHDYAKPKWLAVARKAREMAKEATK